MQKLNPAIVTIVIMFAIVGSLGLAARFTQNEKIQREIEKTQIDTQQNEETVQIAPITENISEPEPMPSQPNMKTAGLYAGYYPPTQIEYINFEFNNFDEERKYPESIRNIPVRDYAKLRCTPMFYFNYEYLDNPNDTALPILVSEDYKSAVDDEKLNAFAKSLIVQIQKQETRRYPSYITRCETDKRDIVIYTIESGGGGTGNKVYVGYIDESPVVIPNEEPYSAAYFGCGDPILLTKSEKMYIRCGGGDGPAGNSSIIEVDLKNNKFKPAIACSYFYNEETEETESSCVQ